MRDAADSHSSLRPLDPELAAIVSAMRAAHAPPPFSGTPEQAREWMRSAVMSARERVSLPVVSFLIACFAGHTAYHLCLRPITAETCDLVVDGESE